VTLALVTIQVRLWVRSQTAGPVEGFTPCKGGGAGQAARVEKESGPSRIVSGKTAHDWFLFLKTFSILQNLFPIQKFI
jgi:hypothetical protein